MMQAENIIFIKFLVLTLSSGFSPLMVNQVIFFFKNFFSIKILGKPLGDGVSWDQKLIQKYNFLFSTNSSS